MTDKELIKQEIERLKEHTAKCGYPRQGDFENGNREGRNYICYKLLSFINSLPEESSEEEKGWIKIDEKHPLPKFEEVLAYNKEWVEADFNPKGVRIGYLTDEGNFVSAKYDPDGEDYISKYEEGDDYQFFEEMEDGTRKTWYNNGDDRDDIEGYRPNLPTHYKKISTDGITEEQQ